MKRLHVLMTAALPFALVAQDTTATKVALLAADRAAASGEAALARAMAPDAVVLLPGEDVLRGSAAFARVLPAMASAAIGRAAWTPVHAVVTRNGAFGCTTGVLNLPAVDSTQSRTGRYASCWQRGADGGWRMVVHSRSLAPPQAKTLPDSLPLAPGSTGTKAPRGVDAARAMADADRAFARFSTDSGGPAGAFARWVAADGMMLGARPVPPRGPEQVGKAFAGFPVGGEFTWGPIDALSQASRDGDLGFTIGEARMAPTPADVSYSKYLTIWRRERDGSYRFIFDIGSARPAPPGK